MKGPWRKGAPLGAFLAVLLVGPTLAADPIGSARTPIEHAVFLMQDNHSFDNLFGTYPGADGIPIGTCMPKDPAKLDAGCVLPQWVGDVTAPQLGQSQAIFEAQSNGGKLDGFVAGQAALGADAPLAMGYYDDRDVPYSWNVADSFVLFDRFFGSAQGGTIRNHMYWVSGAPGAPTDAIPEAGFGDAPTIFDRLQAAGVDWKFYVQNYDPALTFRNRQGMISRPSQVERVPLLAIPRFVDDPKLSSHIVDLSEYYRDLESDTLPAVSYIVPAGGGAHSPTSVRVEQQLGRSLINAITRSSAWSTSVFLWTYDSWGGWYDHVPPPTVDGVGLGFRVPALLVSPFARKGLVDDTQLDYTSMVHFVTDTWGLAPLTSRDAASQSIASALDFANAGRPPAFLPAARAQASTRKEPQRTIIFLAYGSALLVAFALIGAAAFRSRRSSHAHPKRSG